MTTLLIESLANIEHTDNVSVYLDVQLLCALFSYKVIRLLVLCNETFVYHIQLLSISIYKINTYPNTQ